MKLLVFSHKKVWKSDASPLGYATDGGFAMHMQALADAFGEAEVIVPEISPNPLGEVPFKGPLCILPVRDIPGKGVARKLSAFFWVLRYTPFFIKKVRQADVVHAPIPGDIGTIGMLLAFAMRKKLIVRHCGNWQNQRTVAERFWRWFMEKYAGGRNIMLATGGNHMPPSDKNTHVQWIFSSSLKAHEIEDLRKHQRQFDVNYPRLILAARQEQKKGADVAIRAMPAILEAFPGTTLTIVGDGPFLPELKKLAQQTGLGDKVAFTGKISHSEVVRLFQQSDIFVYPTSASEGFPKVVLEAMAAGLAIVATPVSVIPNLLADGAGIIVEAPRPEIVSSAVRSLLADPQMLQRMGNGAQARARAYTLEAWGQKIKELTEC